MAENDLLKRLLDAGMTFTALTQARAEELIRDLVRVGAVQAEQAQASVDELVDRSRRNSEKLIDAVRTEIDDQLARLDLATRDDLDRMVQRFTDVASGLFGQAKPGRERSTSGAPDNATSSAPAVESAPATAAAPATRSATTAKKTPAKKASAKKSPAKKSSANKASAKKSPAKKSPANKASAKKSPAKKSSAKKATASSSASKTPAKKSFAKKAPAPSSNAGGGTTASGTTAAGPSSPSGT